MAKVDIATRWNATGIEFETAGIVVAPEPFIPSHDILLRDNKKVLKGTKYLPLGVVNDLIKAKETPAGWRLPSREESKGIAKLFTGTEIGRKIFELDGYIGLNDMAQYQNAPSIDAIRILNHGTLGYHWTSDLVSELYAYVITSGKRVLNADSYLHIGCGLPLILVRDLQSLHAST